MKMIPIVKCCSIIIMSVVLTAAAVLFRWSYMGREKAAVGEILKKQKKQIVFFAAAYMITAVLALIFYRRKDMSFFSMAQKLILWDALVLTAVIDKQIKKIPNKVLLFLLIVRAAGILTEAMRYGASLTNMLLFSLLGMVIGGLIPLVAMLLSGGGVGAGDMKLYAVTGAFLGLSGILQTMMFSLFLAAVVSLVMLICKKAKMKSTMPMAPFIFAGISIYYILI